MKILIKTLGQMEQMKHAVAEVIFEDPKEHGSALFQKLKGFGNFVERNGTHVFRSVLEPSQDLNEHRVWLFMMLDHERKRIKSMTQGGGRVVCRCLRRRNFDVQQFRIACRFGLGSH